MLDGIRAGAVCRCLTPVAHNIAGFKHRRADPRFARCNCAVESGHNEIRRPGQARFAFVFNPIAAPGRGERHGHIAVIPGWTLHNNALAGFSADSGIRRIQETTNRRLVRLRFRIERQNILGTVNRRGQRVVEDGKISRSGGTRQDANRVTPVTFGCRWRFAGQFPGVGYQVYAADSDVIDLRFHPGNLAGVGLNFAVDSLDVTLDFLDGQRMASNDAVR